MASYRPSCELSLCNYFVRWLCFASQIDGLWTFSLILQLPSQGFTFPNPPTALEDLIPIIKPLSHKHSGSDSDCTLTDTSRLIVDLRTIRKTGQNAKQLCNSFLCCCYKLPHIQRLKHKCITLQFYRSEVCYGSRGLKSRCWQVCYFLEVVGENHFLLRLSGVFSSWLQDQSPGLLTGYKSHFRVHHIHWLMTPLLHLQSQQCQVLLMSHYLPHFSASSFCF